MMVLLCSPCFLFLFSSFFLYFGNSSIVFHKVEVEKRFNIHPMNDSKTPCMTFQGTITCLGYRYYNNVLFMSMTSSSYLYYDMKYTDFHKNGYFGLFLKMNVTGSIFGLFDLQYTPTVEYPREPVRIEVFNFPLIQRMTFLGYAFEGNHLTDTIRLNFTASLLGIIEVFQVKCLFLCKECDDFYNCTSCKENQYLYNRRCLCNDGFYNDSATSTCLPCSSACSSCIGPTDKDCTACKVDFYINGECLKTCPDGFFPKGARCESCGKCKICQNELECSSCIDGYKLDGTYCVSACPMKSFESDGVCHKCIENCDECSSASGCDACAYEYVLTNGKCEKCQPPLVYNSAFSLCERICLANQVFFNNDCLDNCPEGFLKNLTTCSLKTWVTPKLISTSNPYKFVISLSKAWGELISLIISKTETSRLVFLEQDYPTVQFEYEYMNDTDLGVIFHLKKFKPNTMYGFKIIIYPPEESIMLLFNKELIGYLDCSIETQKKKIGPKLFLIDNSYPVFLEFVDDANEKIKIQEFPNFLDILDEKSTFIIPDFSNFDAKIGNFNSEKNFFTLNLTFNASVLGSKSLAFFLLFQEKDLSGQNFSFFSNSSSIFLPDFYVLQNNTVLNVTGQLSQSLATATAISKNINTATMGFTTILSFRSYLLIDVLRNFKFLNIQYPPNMLAVFDSGINMVAKFNYLDINEPGEDPNDNLENKFKYYLISKYFWNNTNVSLVTLLFFYLLGIFFVILSKKSVEFRTLVTSNKIQSNSFLIYVGKVAVHMIYHILVWNLIITQILSNFNESLLYCFTTFMWLPYKNTIGILNIALSLVILVLLLFFIFFIMSKIFQYIKKPNNIFPISLPPKSNNNEQAQTPRSLTPREEYSVFLDASPVQKVHTANKTGGWNFVPWNRMRFLEDFNKKTAISKNEGNSYFSETTLVNKNEKNGTTCQINNYLREETVEETENRKEMLSNRYEVLFKGVECRTPAYFFILIELGRQAFISAILVLMQKFPLHAISLIVGLNLGFLSLLIVLRPNKEIKDFILSLICELCVNLGGIICLIIAIFDYQKADNEEKRINLGWVFVALNWILILLTVGIYLELLAKFLTLVAKSFFKLISKKCRKKNKIMTTNEEIITPTMKETISNNNEEIIDLEKEEINIVSEKVEKKEINEENKMSLLYVENKEENQDKNMNLQAAEEKRISLD